MKQRNNVVVLRLKYLAITICIHLYTFDGCSKVLQHTTMRDKYLRL